MSTTDAERPAMPPEISSAFLHVTHLAGDLDRLHLRVRDPQSKAFADVAAFFAAILLDPERWAPALARFHEAAREHLADDPLHALPPALGIDISKESR